MQIALDKLFCNETARFAITFRKTSQNPLRHFWFLPERVPGAQTSEFNTIVLDDLLGHVDGLNGRQRDFKTILSGVTAPRDPAALHFGHVAHRRVHEVELRQVDAAQLLQGGGGFGALQCKKCAFLRFEKTDLDVAVGVLALVLVLIKKAVFLTIWDRM